MSFSRYRPPCATILAPSISWPLPSGARLARSAASSGSLKSMAATSPLRGRHGLGTKDRRAARVQSRVPPPAARSAKARRTVHGLRTGDGAAAARYHRGGAPGTASTAIVREVFEVGLSPDRGRYAGDPAIPGSAQEPTPPVPYRMPCSGGTGQSNRLRISVHPMPSLPRPECAAANDRKSAARGGR